MTEPAAKSLPPPEKPAEPESDAKLSFFEHLQDLRRRLIRACLGIAVGMALVGYFCERIFRWVMQPVLKSLPEGQQYLHYTGYIEPFMVYLKVALYGGIFVAAPYVLYQFWQFIAPGLYKKERKIVVPFLASATLLLSEDGFIKEQDDTRNDPRIGHVENIPVKAIGVEMKEIRHGAETQAVEHISKRPTNHEPDPDRG